MKNVNVLLAVVLCAGLCVLLGLFNRSADDSLGWNPNEMYMQSMKSSEGSSFTSANLSSGNMSNDGVAVSMRNGSFSLRARSSRASMPVATPQASSLSLSGSTSTSSSGSLIGHMTSSAEYHSFGGGHSGNMGSAMTGMTNSGNVAASFAYSSPSYGVANSGLSSYSPITLSSGTDGTQVMSAEQALISASSSASGLFGSALQNTYGTASYGEYLGMSGSKPSGVRGRQNVGSGSSNNPNGWLAWLANYARGLYGYNDEGTNSYGFDYYQLQEAYAKWLAEWMSDTGLTEDKAPSFDDFLNWFYENEFTYNWTDGTGDSATLHWVPVGSVLPLFMIALLYAIYVAIRRRKSLAEQA